MGPGIRRDAARTADESVREQQKPSGGGLHGGPTKPETRGWRGACRSRTALRKRSRGTTRLTHGRAKTELPASVFHRSSGILILRAREMRASSTLEGATNSSRRYTATVESS